MTLRTKVDGEEPDSRFSRDPTDIFMDDLKQLLPRLENQSSAAHDESYRASPTEMLTLACPPDAHRVAIRPTRRKK